MYYPCSENKGADQLRGYHEAHLRLCFCICRLLVFSQGGSFNVSTFSSDMSMGIGVCQRCGDGFGTHEQIVNSNGEVWHPKCFV